MNGTFREQVEAKIPTERDHVVLEIMRRCNVSLWTVNFAWIRGRRNPKPRSLEIIAEILGTPVGELFPDMKKV